MTANVSLTERLKLFMSGDLAVTDSLLQEILPALQTIAARELSREQPRAQRLSKTELIHEMWLSNFAKGTWQIQDRGHFFALASLAMRRLLVDMARKRLSQRRGGGVQPKSLENTGPLAESVRHDTQQIIEIGQLMDRLERKHPDAARVVDMHYFSGFTLEEIAEETGLTLKQIRLRWKKGMDCLKRGLSVR